MVQEKKHYIEERFIYDDEIEGDTEDVLIVIWNKAQVLSVEKPNKEVQDLKI